MRTVEELVHRLSTAAAELDGRIKNGTLGRRINAALGDVRLMRQAAKALSCDEVELEKRLTKALRAADSRFQKVGGTTRHYVQECLLPELRKVGIGMLLTDGGS